VSKPEPAALSRAVRWHNPPRPILRLTRYGTGVHNTTARLPPDIALPGALERRVLGRWSLGANNRCQALFAPPEANNRCQALIAPAIGARHFSVRSSAEPRQRPVLGECGINCPINRSFAPNHPINPRLAPNRLMSRAFPPAEPR
jgi:hypothetical protein